MNYFQISLKEIVLFRSTVSVRLTEKIILTRIAHAKHSQRRDGRFIFPSSSLILRNRRKGSFVVRKLCGRLTETYNYVFHCRNLFPPPPIAVR